MSKPISMKKAILPHLFILRCILSLAAQKPELVLPAIHSCPITEMSFSADGKYLATVAKREIKLWETSSGRLLRTILSSELVHCIDLSDDGTQLVSSHDNNCSDERFNNSELYNSTKIRYWNMVNGEEIAIIKTFEKPGCIHQLCISHDMRFVFGQYGDSLGVWEIGTGQQKWTMSGNGRATFSPDGKSLLLEHQGLQWVDWANPGEAQTIITDSCLTVQCTPEFVVALTKQGVIKRWDIRKKKLAPDLKSDLSDLSFENGLRNVCSRDGLRFSADGTKLCIVTEDLIGKGAVFRFRILDALSGKLINDKTCPIKGSGKFWIRMSPDLGICVTAPGIEEEGIYVIMRSYSIAKGRFSHEFGLAYLDPSSGLNLETSSGLNYGHSITINRNLVFNGGQILYIERSGKLPNTVFFPELGSVKTGIELDSLKYYTENQTLEVDTKWSLSGGDGLSYELTQKDSGIVMAELFLADGPYEKTKTGFTDGSSRLWAITTPSGLFDASPEMMKSLHYVVGMEVIELAQLKARYWQPGLLQKILGLSRGGLRNVAVFDSVALQPVIQATIEKNKLRITLTERSGGLGKLILYINNKEMSPADINPGRQKTLTVNLDDFYPADITETIGLVAYDANNWLKSQTYELPYKSVGAKGDNPVEPERFDCGSIKPKLYLLMIGTSKYEDVSKSLTYPDLDAAEMAKALGSTGKALFKDNVQLKLLSTAGGELEEPSKINIEKAFSDFAQKATPCDVLVVFFSGHGSTWGKEGDKPNFYYLTKDITSTQLADDKVRNAYAVSDEDLKKWLVAIKARKQVLILDACNSGQAVENLSGIGQRDLNASQVIAFDILKDRTGTFILSGSASDMLSYEAAEYGQGLLTYSLLEGISGTALKGNQVDIMVLFQNSRDVVPKLAQGIKRVQIPVISAPYEAASFPIGIKDSTVQIVLPQRKPVVIQCNFQDKVNYKDGLGLSQALNGYFQDQNAKGVQAKYVFYNISEYAEGFSIWGNYTIQGNQVIVGGRLFKGDKPVGKSFQLTGGKDPAALVKLILKEVGGRISVK
jgi:WD40 repeat protein